MTKKKSSVKKERETTARFNTEECRVLLKAFKYAKAHGLIFAHTEDEIHLFRRVEYRLLDRIEKEEIKNLEKRKRNKDGAETIAGFAIEEAKDRASRPALAAPERDPRSAMGARGRRG